jgi:hypothetical protein
MKKFRFFILLFITSNLLSQNVGINNPTPLESLDVKGNINLTGTLKANGLDGAPNQVLMKNNSGNLAWGDLGEYKNFKMYFYTNTVQTFTVPTGVTTLLIELWSGGGGGALGGGGGSGGYILLKYIRQAGDILNITVGNGGAGSSAASTNGTDGETSSIAYSNGVNNFAMYGGFGASTIFGGAGGFLTSYTTGAQFISFNGQSGRKNTINYQQISPTVYVLNTKYGNGGTAYNQPSLGGEGGNSVEYISGGAGTSVDVGGGQAYGPGEGGGGGKAFGGLGAQGRVIIHW